MPPIDQAALRNRLLRRLAPEDFAALAPRLEPVALPKGHVLIEPDRPFAHATFPESGIGSVVAASPGGLEAESGIFGRDGFAPTSLALGVDRTPHRVVMQVGDGGHRVGADALREAMAERPGVRDLLLRFAHVMAVQASYTALSNGVHPVAERLARWLLMCHDRVGGDDLALTHEFLSLMLAVRRPSVTNALHVLQGHGLIRAERGSVTVTDRRRLRDFAGDAYGRPEAEYERLLGPLR